MEKIIEHFTDLGRFKIVFNPSIRVVKPEGHSVWIDEMYMVNKQYMLLTSTLNDDCRTPLAKLPEDEMNALEYRLSQLVQTKSLTNIKQ